MISTFEYRCPPKGRVKQEGVVVDKNEQVSRPTRPVMRTHMDRRCAKHRLTHADTRHKTSVCMTNQSTVCRSVPLSDAYIVNACVKGHLEPTHLKSSPLFTFSTKSLGQDSPSVHLFSKTIGSRFTPAKIKLGEDSPS